VTASSPPTEAPTPAIENADDGSMACLGCRGDFARFDFFIAMGPRAWTARRETQAPRLRTHALCKPSAAASVKIALACQRQTGGTEGGRPFDDIETHRKP
jgi:hypothetical protein